MAESSGRCGACRMVWDHFTLVTRIWGILTAIALWGIGIDTLRKGTHVEIGLYLIVTGAVVTFLETLFITGKCVTKCCQEESCCYKCWGMITWIDNWKRSILYVILSIVCFIHPSEVWLAVISGIMLLISAICHGAHTIKDRQAKTGRSNNYDRFQEVSGEEETPGTGEATRHDARIEPGFPDEIFTDDDKDFKDNPFKEEDGGRKRSNSFDLGTGSSGINPSGTMVV